ncbi:MAG: hypothetical protein H7X89_12010 [Rhizobiales bacterium]|nr:hypothetical protein [Hyphomicrobiales bacterium]
MATALLAGTAAFASAEYHTSGKLPDGFYECAMISGGMLISFGEIQIEGNIYRGPAYDGNFEGDYNYELMSEGVVLWKGPMGGLSTDGNSVASTVLSSDKKDSAGFIIMVKTSRGNFQQISCSLKK